MHLRFNEEDRPIYKVLPLLNYLQNKRLEIYKPSQFITIEETIIAFVGRTIYLQYSPKKSYLIMAKNCLYIYLNPLIWIFQIVYEIGQSPIIWYF